MPARVRASRCRDTSDRHAGNWVEMCVHLSRVFYFFFFFSHMILITTMLLHLWVDCCMYVLGDTT